MALFPHIRPPLPDIASTNRTAEADISESNGIWDQNDGKTKARPQRHSLSQVDRHLTRRNLLPPIEKTRERTANRARKTSMPTYIGLGYVEGSKRPKRKVSQVDRIVTDSADMTRMIELLDEQMEEDLRLQFSDECHGARNLIPNLECFQQFDSMGAGAHRRGKSSSYQSFYRFPRCGLVNNTSREGDQIRLASCGCQRCQWY